MKANELAVVGSGLLGLYLLAMSVFQVAYVVQAVAAAGSRYVVPGGTIGAAASLVLGVAAGVVLLTGRHRVADRLLRGEGAAAAARPSGWSLGLALLGIYVLVRGGEHLCTAVASALIGARATGWLALTPGAWLMVAGAALLIAARRSGRSKHSQEKTGATC